MNSTVHAMTYTCIVVTADGMGLFEMVIKQVWNLDVAWILHISYLCDKKYIYWVFLHIILASCVFLYIYSFVLSKMFRLIIILFIEHMSLTRNKSYHAKYNGNNAIMKVFARIKSAIINTIQVVNACSVFLSVISLNCWVVSNWARVPLVRTILN